MQDFRNSIYLLLRKSEAFFKTDMVYLTKGNLWLIAGQAVSVLSSLALAVAFANLITPEEYGNYKYVFSIAGVIAAFSLSGLGVAVMRAAAQGHEGTFPYAFKLSLKWSWGIVLISTVLSAYYFLHDNYFLGFSLLIIGAASPIIEASSLYRPFLSGKGDFKRLSSYGMEQSMFPMLCVLVALLLGLPLLSLVAIHFLASALTLWLLSLRTKRLVANNNIEPLTGKLGKHLSIMGIISTISGKLDSILIFQLLGGAELAIFSFAITIPDMIRGYFKNITSLAIPKFAQKTKEEMKRSVWSKVKTVTFVTSAITLVYILTVPYLFQIFFPQYLAAIPYSQVYALTLITSLLLATAYFDSQGVVKERYILNIVINATTIVTTIIGVYFFGIWGAVFARLATRLVNVSLAAFLIARH